MGFDSSSSSRSDVEVRASVGAFRGDMQQIRAEALRGFGALSEESQRAALASEKYDRALLRAKGNTFAVQKATFAYQKEMRALTATTHSTSNATDREERSLGRLLRGAASGTGIFHRLRGAAVFASSSFIGGYGLTAAIRSSTEAAIQHQVVQGQLAAAVDAAGVSYHRNRAAIEEIIHATENLGFAEADSVRSYTLAIRATKDVEKAQHLQAIAADVARGRNISLVSATQLLVRVEAGQVGSLRRLGIEVKKGITGRQALLEVEKQYAGASAAYARSAAGEQDRLRVAIHRTEVEIGTALLPTISRLSGRLASWLGNSKNQARIQGDVNQALHVGTGVVHGLGEAYHVIAPPIRGVNKLLGGTTHSVEVLGAALLALKLRGIATELGLIATNTAAVGSAAAIATPEVNAFKTAEERPDSGFGGGITGGAGGAGGRLAKLGRFVPYTPFLTYAIASYGLDDATRSHAGPNLLGHQTRIERGKRVFDVKVGAHRYIQYSNGQWYDTETGNKISTGEAAKRLGVSEAALRAEMTAGTNTSGMSNDPVHDAGGGSQARTSTPSRRHGVSLAGQLNLAGLRLAQAQTTSGNADDLAALHAEEAIIKAQIAKGGTLAQQTDRYSQLSGVQGQIQGFADQASQAAAAARAKAVAAAAARSKKIEEARAKARREEVAQRHKRLQSLTEVPVQLRIEEAHARSSNASAKTIVAIQEQELAALKKQERQLRAMGASKDLILRLEQRKAAIQRSINSEKKKTAKASQTAASFAALEREFLSGWADVQRNSAPNVQVVQQFPHPPTSDGHREAVYARRAHLAAFDG